MRFKGLFHVFSSQMVSFSELIDLGFTFVCQIFFEEMTRNHKIMVNHGSSLNVISLKAIERFKRVLWIHIL